MACQSIDIEVASNTEGHINGNGYAADPFAPREGHSLAWSNVNYSVNDDLTILSYMKGYVDPKRLTAIMGASGAGKTSLLHVLSGRLHSGGDRKVSRDITIDGVSIDPSSLQVQRKIAFCEQADSLLATSTPREAIRFSARLRLSRKVSDSEVESLTDRILSELGLNSCAERLIGMGQGGGLSGGEKRRVSLGVELVVRPSIIFADEVTSGLDSYNAAQVLDVLKKVSACGASVLFTIHQPNSQIFNQIDDLILLHQGRTMYQGPIESIPGYFEGRGYKIPDYFNPSDWVIHVSQSVKSTKELDEAGFFTDFPPPKRNSIVSSFRSLPPPSSAGPASSLVQRARSSLALMPFTGKKAERRLSVFDTPCEEEHVPIHVETRMLMQREWKKMLRDKNALVIRYGVFLFGSILIAICFAGVADYVDPDIRALQSHVGALYFMLLTGIITTQIVLLEFADERPLFVREYTTNHFRMVSYFVTKFLLDSVSVLSQVLLFMLITYWAVDLNGRFWYLMLSFYSFAMVSTSVGVALASYTNDPRSAKELIPLTILPQILLGGFFVSIKDLPTWITWAQWIMPLACSFRLALMEEFRLCHIDDEDRHVLKCLEGLFESGYDGISNGPWFDDKTVLTSAQVGVYKGGKAIEEYIRLLEGESETDVLSQGCGLTGTLDVSIYPSTTDEGKCVARLGSVTSQLLRPSLSTIPNVESLRGLNVAGHVIQYSLDNDPIMIDTDNVFIPDHGVRTVFDVVFDADKMREAVCDVMETKCPHVFAANGFANTSECVSEMENLPVVDEIEIAGRRRPFNDGNSTSCRTVHAFLAEDNQDHCEHLSYIPLEDPKGQIKCSTSRNVTLDDIFSQDELDFFTNIGTRYGLNESLLSEVVPAEEVEACWDIETEARRVLDEQYGVAPNFIGACNAILESNNATEDREAQYWLTLIAMVVFFRLVGIWLLRRKVDAIPTLQR